MKILLVSHYLPPKSGGIEFVVDQLARGYAGLGHEVVVCGFRASDSESEAPNYRSVSLAGWNGLESLGIPAPLLEPISSWRRIRREMSNSDAVHIHGMALPSSIIALLCARYATCSVVITEHVGLIEFSNRIYGTLQSLAFRIAAHLAKRVSATVTVLNSRVLLEMKIRVAPCKVLQISNGVDSEFFHPGAATEREALRKKWDFRGPTVLAVARNVPKKGLEDLRRATEGQTDFATIFVGPGTEVLESSDGRCKSFGTRDQTDCAELYRAADLFVLPSRGEGLPLVVLEALSSGLPIVMADDAAVRSVLPDGAITYVPFHQPESLRSEILRRLSSPDELARSAEAGRTSASEKFGWPTVISEYLALLSVKD